MALLVMLIGHPRGTYREESELLESDVNNRVHSIQINNLPLLVTKYLHKPLSDILTVTFDVG